MAHCYQKRRRKTKLRVEKARQQTNKKREKCWRKQKKHKKSRNYTNFFSFHFFTIKIFAVFLRGYMKLPLTHSVVVI